MALIVLLSSVVSGSVLLAQSTVTHPIRFEDIAGKAGVHFTAENSPTPEKHQPETMPRGHRVVRLRRRRTAGHLPGQRRRDAIAGENGSEVFKSPLPQQRQWNIHRRDGARRSGRSGLRDGRGGGRLRQRWPAGPVSGQRQRKSALSQQWQRHLHRGHRESRFGRRHAQWPQDVVYLGGLVRLQQRRSAGPVRRELRRVGSALRTGLHGA